MQEVKDLEEVKKYFGHYKNAALFTVDNKNIIRFSRPGKSYDEKQNQILTHLTSELTPDGIYIIKLRNDINAGSDVAEIYYKKGNPENLEALKETLTTPATMAENTQDKFLTYQAALDYERRIMRLEAENTALKQQNAELTEELEELEAEEEEIQQENKTLSESAAPAGTIAAAIEGLKSIIPSITGIIQTHYDLKERELKIKERQITPQQPAQQQQQQQQQPDDDQAQILDYLQILKQTAPDEYNKIVESIKQPQ